MRIVSACQQQDEDTRTHIENQHSTATMTNGTSNTIAGAPQHPINACDATFLTTQNLLLKQMLSENMTGKPYLSINKIDARQTRVKHSPDGAVQITYKKMVHSQPVNSNTHPVFILPKTTIPPSNATFTVCNPTVNGFCSNSPASFSSVHTSSMVIPTCSLPQNTFVFSNASNQPLSNNRCTLPNRTLQPNGFRTSNSLTISLPKLPIHDVTNQPFSQSFGTLPPLDKGLINNSPKTLTNPSINMVTSFSQSASMNSPAFGPTPFNTLQNVPPTSNLQSGDPMMSSSQLPMDLDGDLLASLDMNSFEKELGLLKERMTDLPVVSDIDRKLFESNPVLYPSDRNMASDVVVTGHIDMQVSPTSSSPLIENNNNQTCNKYIDIIDVSPEAASLTGDNKVILVGSWNAKDSRYRCRFGDVVVEAELIQNGVLKCYSPVMLRACQVKLCVLVEDVVISNSVDFKFFDATSRINRNSDSPTVRHEWLHITDKDLRETLKDRFLSISEILSPCNSVAVNIDPNTENFEDQLIDLCKKLIVIEVDIAFDYSVHNTMTLLHISASLGYLKLIQFLINWVESSSNILIQAEASPSKADEFSMLPIMWSAARGHFNTSCVLLQWYEQAIDERDCCGCTAIDLARECGHDSLVDYLKRIKRKSLFSRENSDANSPKLNHTPQNSISESRPVEGSPSLRTLGRTLAHIQSLLNDESDRGETSDLDCDDEDSTSLFESSYSPNTSASGVLSINAPDQSPAPHQSPFNRQIRETAEFCEFFYQAKKIEKDFAELTLTGMSFAINLTRYFFKARYKTLNYLLDEEQEELYRAANVIQTAYKTYKERRQRRDQELSAAVLIQSYYRRYKQYAAFKKMQKGALVIQSQYRAHREKAKRKCHAASVIQSYYRRYKQRKAGENRVQTQMDRHKNSRYLAQISKRFSHEIPDIFLNELNSLVTSTQHNIYSNPLQTSCPTSLQTSRLQGS